MSKTRHRRRLLVTIGACLVRAPHALVLPPRRHPTTISCNSQQTPVITQTAHQDGGLWIRHDAPTTTTAIDASAKRNLDASTTVAPVASTSPGQKQTSAIPTNASSSTTSSATAPSASSATKASSSGSRGWWIFVVVGCAWLIIAVLMMTGSLICAGGRKILKLAFKPPKAPTPIAEPKIVSPASGPKAQVGSGANLPVSHSRAPVALPVPAHRQATLPQASHDAPQQPPATRIRQSGTLLRVTPFQTQRTPHLRPPSPPLPPWPSGWGPKPGTASEPRASSLPTIVNQIPRPASPTESEKDKNPDLWGQRCHRCDPPIRSVRERTGDPNCKMLRVWCLKRHNFCFRCGEPFVQVVGTWQCDHDLNVPHPELKEDEADQAEQQSRGQSSQSWLTGQSEGPPTDPTPLIGRVTTPPGSAALAGTAKPSSPHRSGDAFTSRRIRSWLEKVE